MIKKGYRPNDGGEDGKIWQYGLIISEMTLRRQSNPFAAPAKWIPWLWIGLGLLLGGLTSCNSRNAAGVGLAANAPTPTFMPTYQWINLQTPLPTFTPNITPTETQTPNPRPSPLPSPSPVTGNCLEAGGQITTGSLKTTLLPQSLEYRVYLPPCYQVDTERFYPVLYLIHGQSYNDDQWDRLGADETADRLIASSVIPPFIIVMPRDRIWTPPSDDKFGGVLVELLVPWIDAHYRTLPSRYFRAIGGLSRGASWSVHLGLRYWGVFGAVGAHSLPLFWTDMNNMDKLLDAIPLETMPRFYIDIGDHDLQTLIDSASWFASMLDQRGIPHEWHLNSGRHEEEYWQSHMEQYLRWYTEEW
ncbi:MAG: alpha/beta hydrolase-fold protein [Chloroflexota bacterium]